MRKIALCMSALVLSGCVLSDLGNGNFLGRSSSSQQMTASAQVNEMLGRVMLSCNNKSSDFSEIVSLLEQQEYQQVSAEYRSAAETYFYNSSKPIYFLGYPVQYFSFANEHYDGRAYLRRIAIGLPPEAFSRIKPYDERRTEEGRVVGVRRLDMKGFLIFGDDDTTSSVKYAVLECY